MPLLANSYRLPLYKTQHNVTVSIRYFQFSAIRNAAVN